MRSRQISSIALALMCFIGGSGACSAQSLTFWGERYSIGQSEEAALSSLKKRFEVRLAPHQPGGESAQFNVFDRSRAEKLATILTHRKRLTNFSVMVRECDERREPKCGLDAFFELVRDKSGVDPRGPGYTLEPKTSFVEYGASRLILAKLPDGSSAALEWPDPRVNGLSRVTHGISDL